MKILSFLTLMFLVFTIQSVAFAQMEYVEVKDQQGNVRKFSRLFMGTDHLGQQDWVAQGQPAPTEAQIFEVLDEAVKRGINVIDTSPIYVDGIEHIVGDWMRSRREAIKADSFYTEKNLNPDRKVYVLSKGGFPFDLFYAKALEAGQHSPELINVLRNQNVLTASDGVSPQQLQSVPPGTYASRLYGQTDEITQRVAGELGNTTSNLDGDLTVYLMHRDDFDSIEFNVIPRDQTPVSTIMDSLSRPEISGMFQLLGFSNWTPDRVQAALQVSQQNPTLARPTFNSPYFSLFEMGERSIHARGIQVKHPDLIDPHFIEGIFINPYSPLGGFSILDKPSWEDAKASAKQKYDSGDAYWQNVYLAIFTPQNEVRYRRANLFLQNFNKISKTSYTIDQLLNAYALAHTRLNFLTVGPITVAQVQRTVDSLPFSKKLRAQDLDYLYNVSLSDLARICDGLVSKINP